MPRLPDGRIASSLHWNRERPRLSSHSSRTSPLDEMLTNGFRVDSGRPLFSNIPASARQIRDLPQRFGPVMTRAGIECVCTARNRLVVLQGRATLAAERGSQVALDPLTAAGCTGVNAPIAFSHSASWLAG